METPTPSLTLSNHTRDSTDFLKLSFIAELPEVLFWCLKKVVFETVERRIGVNKRQ